MPDPDVLAPRPLISVLVRSMARPTLHRALASVALQTAPAVEVLVLNALGRDHPELGSRCGPFPLRLIDPQQALDRPVAANALMAHATGDHLLFLDDDDSLDPDHLQRLQVALLARPDACAAYAGVRLVDDQGREQSVLDEPFDAARLACENFLPIHAVLFDRHRAGPPPWFDTALQVYEDWDFWLGLSLKGAFVHVPGVSATYHLVGDSGLTPSADPERVRTARLAFFAKWSRRLPHDALEAIAAQAATRRAKVLELDAERIRLDKLRVELGTDLDRARAAAAPLELRAQELQHQWTQAQVLLQSTLHQWQQTQVQHQACLAQLEALQSELQQVRHHHLAANQQLGEASLREQQLHQRVERERAALAELQSLQEPLRQQLEAAQAQHHEAVSALESEHRRHAAVQARLHDQTLQLAALETRRAEERRAWEATLQQQQAAVQQARGEGDRLAGELAAARASHEAQQAIAEQARRWGRHLEADLHAARQGYRELEAGYQAVTSSLSWRLTAPLRVVRGLGSAEAVVAAARRAVRSLVRMLPVSGPTKQRIKVWMVSRPWAARWMPWFAVYQGAAVLTEPAPAPVPPAPGAPAAASVNKGVDKEAVRAQAAQALDQFLLTGQRVNLKPASDPPQVSVIVVLFNQAGLSLWCLQALEQSIGVSFEVLIVDNASTDRMPELLERVDGAVVLPQSTNLGFLRAVNLAAAQARGEHLLLLNNDATVEPGTLAAAVARLAQDPGAGAVGGPILLWDGRLQEAGSVIWQDGSCLGYGRGDDPMDPPYRFVRDVDYCSGAFLMVRRRHFRELGGFDDIFAPAYYEESDFCVRLWKAGHRIVYDPAVRIRHFEFASDQGSNKAIELQVRNRAHFVRRHPDFLQHQQPPDVARLPWARHRLAAGRLRILAIDDRVPLPWLGQGYPRASHMIAELASAGHFVTHYPLQFPHEAPADIAQALPQTVEVMVDRGLAGFAAFLESRRGYYDVVLVSRPHNMEVVRSVMTARPGCIDGARILYDAEALFSLRDIAKAQVLGTPLDEAAQAQRVAAEMQLAQGASGILTVSEREARHFRQAGYADVQVLGHALVPAPTARPFEERRGFLFVGALVIDDSPNVDSILWFVREVWPEIRRQMPDAELRLVGPCQAPAIQALAVDGVVLVGPVDDLTPQFDAARVFIVPTRYAAGIAHKAHEAAAYGLPMVCSELIAAQLGWEQTVAVGADAAAFARACLHLHNDSLAWQRARHEALVAVARDCSADRFRQALLAATGGVPLTPATTTGPSAHGQRLEQLRQLLQPPADLSHAPTEATQRDDSAVTADLWGRDAQARLNELNRYRHWASHPVTGAWINTRMSGQPDRGWVGHLKAAHFQTAGRRGVSLGCGSGAAVVDVALLGIVQHMEGLDISPGAIEVARQRARDAGVQDRATFAVADLNSPVLEGPYDLVMFEQSLHHIDQLDRVLAECARALSPQGLFVINEYVGPDRFQWNDDVDRLMNELLLSLPERYRIEPSTGSLRQRVHRVAAAEVMAVDPSEAIHSSQILQACDRNFECVERRDFGGTLLNFLLAEIAANFDPDDEGDRALLLELVRRETALIERGVIAPDFVFAVYRARRPQER